MIFGKRIRSRPEGRQYRKIAVSCLICFLVAVLLPYGPCLGSEKDPGWSDVQKKFRKAFKPLPVPGPIQLEKTIGPSLPQGVAIEPGPFEALARRLLENYQPRLSLRVEAMKALKEHPTVPAGRLIRDGLKVVSKENGEFARRVRKVEQDYGSVYDKGYMDAGEKERRTRKLAAVLIPFYTGLMARNDVVVGLAVEALSAMKEGEALIWLAGPAVKDSEAVLRASAVQALGRIGGSRAKEVLGEAVKREKDPQVRCKALNAMMSWPLKEVKGTVIEALKDSAWEVRALAVAICARGKLVEAARQLVEALAKEDGRLRKDIDDALFSLLGVRYYGDAALWKKWMEANKEKIEEKAGQLEEKGEYDKALGKVEPGKALSAEAGGKEEKKKATSSFYGISTFSKKLIYIIDISRSMMSPAGTGAPEAQGGGAGPWAKPKGNNKIDIAKWQLHRAVHALPKDAVFNIIVYSESYMAWQEGMVKATARFKAEAHGFIDGLKPNGTTNIYDSLVKGFEIAGTAPPGVVVTGKKKKELKADTIYLLSDGNPNRGRITEPERIIEDIRGRNPGIVIHTIGIGEAAQSPLMKRLAEENGGHYAEFK